MKIFNKFLGKNLNSIIFLNRINNKKADIQNIYLLSKTFARNFGRAGSFMNENAQKDSNDNTNNSNENNSFQAPPQIKIEKFSNDFENFSQKMPNYDKTESFGSRENNDFRNKSRGPNRFQREKFNNSDNFADEADSGQRKFNRVQRDSFGDNNFGENKFRGDKGFRSRKFDDDNAGERFKFRERRPFNADKNDNNFESKKLHHNFFIFWKIANPLNYEYRTFTK